jgi:hypothetical protein
LLSALWRETFGYCGIVDFHFRMLYDLRNTDLAERREWIEQSVDLACRLFS